MLTAQLAKAETAAVKAEAEKAALGARLARLERKDLVTARLEHARAAGKTITPRLEANIRRSADALTGDVGTELVDKVVEQWMAEAEALVKEMAPAAPAGIPPAAAPSARAKLTPDQITKAAQAVILGSMGGLDQE